MLCLRLPAKCIGHELLDHELQAVLWRSILWSPGTFELALKCVRGVSKRLLKRRSQQNTEICRTSARRRERRDFNRLQDGFLNEICLPWWLTASRDRSLRCVTRRSRSVGNRLSSRTQGRDRVLNLTRRKSGSSARDHPFRESVERNGSSRGSYHTRYKPLQLLQANGEWQSGSESCSHCNASKRNQQ